MLGLRTQSAAEEELAALDSEIEAGEPVTVRQLSDGDGAAARLSRSRDG